MRISQETIDAVRAATNVVEVVGEFVPLTAAGKNYKGLCPFHDEKTPSFIVSPDRQTYHCFGCGAGGNVFTFLKQHQGLEFLAALELLAGRAGILLPQAAPGPGRADAETGSGRILAALSEATQFFEHNLWDREAGRRGREYLESRGLTETTARAARLGYAFPGFDHLRRKLTANFDAKTLIAAGLLVERGPERSYDRFRDRLMFPILGPSGQPLGFGARSLDGSEPKYLNTPETAVYHKREVLYGLQAARAVLARRGTAWIVEGYMDVLALHQAGFGEALAVSGTALTDRHALLLRRHAPRVVLLFDGDEAGRTAILRSLPPLMETGIGVAVALLPDGEDPDSLVRRGGPEAIQGVVAGAASVVSFIIAHFHGTLGKREARAEALRHLVQLGSRVPDGVSRRLFAEETSRRLGFDEATLAREIEAGRAGSTRQPGPARVPASAPPNPSPRPPARANAAERQLLALALGRPWVVQRIRSELPLDAVRDPQLKQLLVLVLEREGMNQSIRPADLIDPEMDAGLSNLVTALAVDPTVEEAEAADAEALIAQLRGRVRAEERAQIRALIREHEAAGHEAEVRELVLKLAGLMQAE